MSAQEAWRNVVLAVGLLRLALALILRAAWTWIVSAWAERVDILGTAALVAGTWAVYMCADDVLLLLWRAATTGSACPKMSEVAVWAQATYGDRSLREVHAELVLINLACAAVGAGAGAAMAHLWWCMRLMDERDKPRGPYLRR